MKWVIQSMLLILVFAAVGYWAWGQIANPAPAKAPIVAKPISATTPQQQEHTDTVVVVTYFTTDVRCASCRKIEELTRETLKERFAPELAAGTVRFQTLNLDQKEYKHYASDYELAFKTVVISRERSGQLIEWEKCDEVWSHLNNPEAFKAYLEASVRSHLMPLL